MPTTIFDPNLIHTTRNVQAAFGGTLPVVEHCHHCVGGNCAGTCIMRDNRQPVGCNHYGIPDPKEQ